MGDFIIIANLIAGGAGFVTQDVLRYDNDRPMACGDIRLRKRRHLATGFGSSLDAEDWVNDAHNKDEYMRANGVSFFSVAYRGA